MLALVDALARAGIAFRLARHENAAGFMAEGLWHVTGALPVLVATLGPGVANAVNVVANAQQDRVPLIFVTGCVDAAMAESYTHQVFDHAAVLRPLVKGSFRAAPGTEALVVAKAVALARRGRPGPVHIDLPISVAEATVQSHTLPAIAPVAASLPADLSAASRMLAAAAGRSCSRGSIWSAAAGRRISSASLPRPARRCSRPTRPRGSFRSMIRASSAASGCRRRPTRSCAR